MSKKIIKSLCMAIAMSLSTGVSAAPIEFEEQSYVVDSLIKDDRTYVAVRDTGEVLGVEVDYDQATQTITINNHIDMKAGSTDYTIHDIPYRGDVAPLIENGKTYLPLRILCEALGYDVRYYEGAAYIDTDRYPYVDQLDSELTDIIYGQEITLEHCATIIETIDIMRSNIGYEGDTITSVMENTLALIEEYKMLGEPTLDDVLNPGDLHDELLEQVEAIQNESLLWPLENLVSYVYSIPSMTIHSRLDNMTNVQEETRTLLSDTATEYAKALHQLTEAENFLDAKRVEYENLMNEMLYPMLSSTDIEVLEEKYDELVPLITELIAQLHQDSPNKAAAEALQKDVLALFGLESIEELENIDDTEQLGIKLPEQEPANFGGNYATLLTGILAYTEGVLAGDEAATAMGILIVAMASENLDNTFYHYLELSLNPDYESKE